MYPATQTTAASLSRVWAGRVLTGIAVLFMIFDGVTKLMRVPQVVEATAQLGFPERSIPLIGSLLLACTIVYVIPATSAIGAVLLTGYLGGAVAAQLRIGAPLFDTIFPILFAVLVWAGLLLRDEALCRLLP